MMNEKSIEIGKKILLTARDNLYFQMRFLDMALCAFSFEAREGINAGTDGEKIYFDPSFLMDVFQKNVNLTNRLYLHITLHGVYKHFFRLEDRDRRLWDLSCDVAVESIIDSLTIGSVKMRIPALRDSLYTEVKRTSKVIAADSVYSYLEGAGLEEDTIARYEAEFLFDNHNLWYHEDKEKRSQNEQKWDNISSKTQTSMETFNKEAGKNSGDMLDAITLANKRKKNYAQFLQKFAVYHEEMGINTDEFDTIFYTYGLNTYGNMPLIEPLESKEIKRIQDFVIAIDTSYSCSREEIIKFLTETAAILYESESFFKKVRIRILQCDTQIKKEDIITSREEMQDYANHLFIAGRGGTDFRPVFEHIDELVRKGEMDSLRGLLYFTDGEGIFPKTHTVYETVFVIPGGANANIPDWAIKMEI